MKIRISFIYLSVLLIASCSEKSSESILLNLSQQSSTTELFGEQILSTGLYERDLAISLKGDLIIYTLGDAKQNRRCLVQLSKNETGWSAPEVLNISGTYQDIEPFLTPDGSRLYFASNRPMNGNNDRKDYNIWYAKKLDNNWGTPIALDTMINTPKDEFFPSLSQNGNLYFTATRSDGIGREDIFVSKYIDGKLRSPTVLDTMINSAVYEFNAYINPEEDLLIFSSFGRKDGYGGGDLYYSRKTKNGNWSKAKNMGKSINSPKLDYCPFIDYPRNNFYFSSERIKVNTEPIKTPADLIQIANQPGNGFGDIYRIQMNESLFQ